MSLNLFITIPLATMIESVHRVFKTIFRTIYFLPRRDLVGRRAVMWGYIYNQQYGLLNDVLSNFGVTPIGWLQDPRANVLGFQRRCSPSVIATCGRTSATIW
ncbi:MAG: sugar ABC transporter permease [Chloroflexi bacterium]|uniref:hypothetical protein n=1 Tax=Candidatus Flexifilum breve TaxID=3140694 RepID=UPI0031357C70|nr:sugar ABC transporter permease [Chloroflexota bacterium]